MQNQRGNFLLQALLALTLLFAFVPFVAIKLLGRESDALLYATTRQVDNAITAARIFIRENANKLPYERTVISGDSFADILEPYGLPLGFTPQTALGQDISLIINKDVESVSAYLELKGGRMNALKRAELVRRIGYYAADAGDGDIHIGIALDNVYSDIVRRNETDVDAGAFLVDLDMGTFALSDGGHIAMRRGEFDGAEIGLLTINGIESGRKVRNNISVMVADKTIFQSQNGESALSREKVRVINATDKITSRTTVLGYQIHRSNIDAPF